MVVGEGGIGEEGITWQFGEGVSSLFTLERGLIPPCECIIVLLVRSLNVDVSIAEDFLQTAEEGVPGNVIELHFFCMERIFTLYAPKKAMALLPVGIEVSPAS